MVKHIKEGENFREFAETIRKRSRIITLTRTAIKNKYKEGKLKGKEENMTQANKKTKESKPEYKKPKPHQERKERREN